MYDQNFKNQVVVEYNNGITQAEVCRRHGISVPTLRKWVQEHNGSEPLATISQEPLDEQEDEACAIEVVSVVLYINGSLVRIKRKDVVNLADLFTTLAKTLEEE